MPAKRYTNKEKEQACIAYHVNGSMMSVSRDMDIPESTLRSWRDRGDWDELSALLREEKAQEHRQAYSRLVDKALRAAEKGLDNLEGKDLTASDIRQLTIASATATDKVRLADNQPTRVTATHNGLASLAEEFRRLAENHQLVPRSTIIEHKD